MKIKTLKYCSHLTLITLVIISIAFSIESKLLVKVYRDDSRNNFGQQLNMRLYFSDDSLKYKVTLAENGWQIYDSTLYFKNKDFFCEVKYRKDQFSYPFYSLGDTICHKSKISKKFNDELSLVRFYTSHLEYLLSLNPKSFKDSFWFSDSLRPMIFASFGIPHECLIKSFKYEMQDNQLKEDQFYFDCCRLKRKYLEL